MNDWIRRITIAVVAIAAAPAAGQQVYVPLTSYPGDGTVLELVVTNPDPELTRLFSGAVLAEGVDGKASPGTATETIGVAPGATRVIVGPPGVGLWRLEGFAGLELAARLRVPGGASAQQGDQVPLLSAESVHPAGATVQTQSLLSAAGTRSDFAIFNAGQAEASCEARVHRADGAQVQGDYLLRLPALSFHLFENVPTDLVGGAQVSDVRVAVGCDQPFFVFSRTVHPGTGYVSFHTAATRLASGLPAPGSPPPPPPPPPGGNQPPPPGNQPPPASEVERFTRAGLFYTVTPAEPALSLDVALPAGVAYSELAIAFDFEHGGWNAADPAAVVNLLYLTRGQFAGDTFALITTRGPGKNVVRNEITVDLPAGEKLSRVTKAALEPGRRYHVEYLYDGAAERWTLTVSGDGATVAALAGPITGPVWSGAGAWTLLLSDVPAPGHVSSLGWRYFDLVLEWRP